MFVNGAHAICGDIGLLSCNICSAGNLKKFEDMLSTVDTEVHSLLVSVACHVFVVRTYDIFLTFMYICTYTYTYIHACTHRVSMIYVHMMYIHGSHTGKVIIHTYVQYVNQ